MKQRPTLFLMIGCLTACSQRYQEDDYMSATGCRITQRETLFGSVQRTLSKDVIGSSLDPEDRKVLARVSESTLKKIDEGKPLAVQDIIRLHECSISDETITNYIQNTRTSYNLSHEDIRRMQHAGVSQTLINYIIDRGR